MAKWQTEFMKDLQGIADSLSDYVDAEEAESLPGDPAAIILSKKFGDSMASPLQQADNVPRL